MTVTLVEGVDRPAVAGIVYRWDGYDEAGGVRSLLRCAESNADSLRARLLSWAHDAGQFRVGGKRIVEHLSFEAGFSYWWMTPIAERDLYGFPTSDLIRLLALSDILEERRPACFRLVSARPELDACCRDLASRLGIAYHWNRVPGRSAWRRQGGVTRWPANVAQAARALIRQFRVHRRLRRGPRTGWHADPTATALCGYFANVDANAAAEGHFRSFYWGGLPVLLRESGRSINWIHHNAASDADRAMAWATEFNRRPDREGFHAFADSFVTGRVVLRVIARMCRLWWIAMRLRGVEPAFRPAGSAVSFWPLLREHWYRSMIGADAVTNLIALETYDAAMAAVPPQSLGLYLCENYGWERAFIRAWRRHGHGELLAVVHTTVRYWDLRYHTDPRSLETSGSHPLPQPDRICINGPGAHGMFGAASPSSEVETLRVEGSPPRRPGAVARVRLLALGDFLPAYTTTMLRLLAAAHPAVAGSVDVDVKPHPVSAIDLAAFPQLPARIIDGRLHDLLEHYDVVFASSSTSAAVEAWTAGLQVIVALDDRQLNLSPLRGRRGVTFVSSVEELALALSAEPTISGDQARAYFHVDSRLPRWRALIAGAGHASA